MKFKKTSRFLAASAIVCSLGVGAYGCLEKTHAVDGHNKEKIERANDCDVFSFVNSVDVNHVPTPSRQDDQFPSAVTDENGQLRSFSYKGIDRATGLPFSCKMEEPGKWRVAQELPGDIYLSISANENGTGVNPESVFIQVERKKGVAWALWARAYSLIYEEGWLSVDPLDYVSPDLLGPEKAATLFEKVYIAYLVTKTYLEDKLGGTPNFASLGPIPEQLSEKKSRKSWSQKQLRIPKS